MSVSVPTPEQILKLANGFRAACVLGAAAEFDLFSLLAEKPKTMEAICKQLESDPRATRMMLDGLVAIRVLDKSEGVYSVPKRLVPWLVAETPETLLPMLQHLSNLIRGWDQLAWTVRAGIPAPRSSSIRGPEADRESFIAAMHSVSGPAAAPLVKQFGPPPFRHLLDVGGASGTWTLALLEAMPEARATIFDLPDAIKQAQHRIHGTRFADRIELVAGDFYHDDLPPGADLAWVSAIIHQHSLDDSRRLFRKVFDALTPGGQIAIRDFVMEPGKTTPAEGALFAINMLVNTASGGTFAFVEIAEALRDAGFENPEWTVQDSTMNSIVTAVKPV